MSSMSSMSSMSVDSSVDAYNKILALAKHIRSKCPPMTKVLLSNSEIRDVLFKAREIEFASRFLNTDKRIPAIVTALNLNPDILAVQAGANVWIAYAGKKDLARYAASRKKVSWMRKELASIINLS